MSRSRWLTLPFALGLFALLPGWNDPHASTADDASTPGLSPLGEDSPSSLSTCTATGAPCKTGQRGVCADGTCAIGVLICRRNVEPSAETCDGKDNDCDGTVDEGNPGAGSACQTGIPGVCAAGTTICQSGALRCVANAGASEVCDGKDNDCDGSIDEGNPQGGASCAAGGVGMCAAGTTICQSGSLRCVQNTPTSEVCDGKDNDCDGTIDDGYPGAGVRCNTGLPGECAEGGTVCVSGSLRCMQSRAASAESCDGKDNDCDGTIDDNTPSGWCSTGKPGLCNSGRWTCLSGSMFCVGTVSPSPEVPNDGKDNDCDGRVDEP